MRTELSGIWNLSYTDPETGETRSIPAHVPGNVEPDLVAAGLLSDPIPPDTLFATTHLDGVDDWTYTRIFNAPAEMPGERQVLVFEGIDTICDVYLNDSLIHHGENMFLTHRVDVTGKLLPENQLKVIIRSPLLWARNKPYDVMSNSRSNSIFGGQPFLRKNRHAWGWDNAPRLLTCGIWRPCYLETLPPVTLGEPYLFTERVTPELVTLGFIWNLETPEADLRAYSLSWRLSFGNETLAEGTEPVHFVRGTVRLALSREETPLWWPVGFGPANLCDLELTLLRVEEELAAWRGKWGIRTVRLSRTEGITPENQGDFRFYVNEEPIYIKGTNWKTADAFPSLADRKVETVLEKAKDLRCNMIRIWGGGIYEDHPFFDYCDREGILVWQDFMFAGEFSTRDESYCRAVEEEAFQVVQKLRNHPSLAIWCGDNEDDECLHWNNAETTLLPSDNRISREILREAVIRYDPYRGYVESSPFISDINWVERHAPERPDHKTRHPLGVSEHMPEVHLYTPVLDVPKVLRDCFCRFIGETGPYYTCAVSDSEEIFAREYPRLHRLWDEEFPKSRRNLQQHQTDSYMQTWIQTGRELCQAVYGRDFALSEWKDFKLAINLICAGVFKEIIEYCRVDRPDKTGVLWWSLFDMWPMICNYSVVDAEGNPKLPYYWIRESQQDFALLMVQKELGGDVGLYAANDTLTRHSGSYQIIRVDAEGEERMVACGVFDEKENSARLLQLLPGLEDALYLIMWQEGKEFRINHFVKGKADFETWKRWNQRLSDIL